MSTGGAVALALSLLALQLTAACGARTTLGIEGDAARMDAGAAAIPDAGSEPRPDAGFVVGVDAGHDAGADAGPSDAAVPFTPPERGCSEIRTGVEPPTDVPQVDLLFVIDDSRSMAEEQALLAEGFPVFARALASGDLDGDGTLDFPPVVDMHVGVVSTDMGWYRVVDDELVPIPCFGGVDFPGGYDGILRPIDRTRPGCESMSEDFFLRYEAGESIADFGDAFSCLARIGADGCGFEQPLEAALKALTPASSEIRFAGDTVGNGDTLNAGFLRPNSILAVVVVTDEDDESTANGSFLNAMSAEEAVLGDEWLHPTQRYLDGFQALRADPDQVVFAVIAGVPPDRSTPIDTQADAQSILDDARMERVYVPRAGTRLRQACGSPQGTATPARRLVDLTGQMPGRSVVQSICQDDFRPAIRVIAERLGELVERTFCVDGEG